MLEIILKGRWVMIPLLTCSVLTWAVIFERLVSLKSAQIDTRGFLQKIGDLIRQNKTDDALLLTESTPGPVASILNAGLRKFEFLRSLARDPQEIETGVVKAMEDQGVHVVAELERYLVVLATIGNIAPLFGFLGTVTGMISAFERIVARGGIDPKEVAGGIAEALITTAAGLIIAVPAYLAYNAFTARVQSFVLEIEESSAQLMEAVASSIASKEQPAS